MSDKEIIQKIFDMRNLSFGRYGWVWWFWLFFFENPLDPKKSRQIGILWSAKNDANIKCNGMGMGTKDPLKEDGSLRGGVAAWYFDGLKMHDNLLLSKVKINQNSCNIFTTSPKTTFQFKNDVFYVNVEDKMKFEAKLENDNEFAAPSLKEHKHLGFGYEMIGINKLDLKVMIDDEISEGSAYFQKVYLNSPPIPWYWGIFHFEHGASLSYFNPYFLSRSVKKDISFYDGEMLHRFKNITVKKTENSLPTFCISANEGGKSIEFLVETYSKTLWNFTKKRFFIPIKFSYKQYPAKIIRFEFKDKQNNLRLSENDLGIGIGNAEHSRGILI